MTWLVLLVGVTSAATKPGCDHNLSAPRPPLHHVSLYEVQTEKLRSRSLDEYTGYLLNPYADAAYTAVISPGFTDLPRTIPKMLGRMNVARPLRWSDVGAGYAIPFRQLKRDHPDLAARLEMTAVDLFDWDRLNDVDEEVAALRHGGARVLDPEFKPQYKFGDLARVTPARQHLITSVESIQYVANKLGTLVALYNRLAPGGLLIVSTEHYWSFDLLYAGGQRPEGHSILSDVLDELGRHGIVYAKLWQNWEKVHTLAIRRRAGTKLRLTTPMSTRRTRRFGFRQSFYPTEPGQSAITVETTTK